jgi:hypothetical protein
LVDPAILDGNVKTKRKSQLVFNLESLNIADGDLKEVFSALELHFLHLGILA